MLYSEMNEKEQKKWRIQFVTFTKEQLPLLLKARDNWDPKFDAVSVIALELINAFSYAQAFVKDCLLYKDYARSITAMEGYFNIIKKELSARFEDDLFHNDQNIISMETVVHSSSIINLSEKIKPFLSVCKATVIKGVKWIKNTIIITIKKICCTLK